MGLANVEIGGAHKTPEGSRVDATAMYVPNASVGLDRLARIRLSSMQAATIPSAIRLRLNRADGNDVDGNWSTGNGLRPNQRFKIG